MEMERINKLYEDFLKEWPRERVEQMTLEEYTSAGSKDTFTYWLEARLQEWGSIWGGSAYKFGIYNCANEPDGDQLINKKGRMHDDDYAWYTMYGITRDEAFANVKKTILTIIDAVRKNDLTTIDSLKMGSAYKWKIAFHYQPDLTHPIVLPVYKFDKECLLKLPITFPKKASIKDIQNILLENKPAEMSIFDYGRQLWGAMYDDDDKAEGNEVIEMENEPILEYPVANYITQFDGQTLTEEELVAAFKDMFDKAEKGDRILPVMTYGMLYAPFLEKMTKNGPQSVVYKALGKDNVKGYGDEVARGVNVGLMLRKLISSNTQVSVNSSQNSNPVITDSLPYLRALRTKPFMLLAGISGTGKSRIVRKLAQASVTEELQRLYDEDSVKNGFNRWNLHKPANFELVQVKPNWHNSLEVVGYKSNIGGEHYEYTPFVEFVARAWQHPDMPFFLCLDEMNLAPVEQYFAEFLSAIESRSFENGEYETDPIIKPFKNFEELGVKMAKHLAKDNEALQARFMTKGLTLPKNLFVLGTVNMDETTFSFSRKVLDRAMSVMMNDVNYDNFFKGATEKDVEEMNKTVVKNLINREISGLKAANNAVGTVKGYLTEVNKVLDGSPFKLGYRAANEALLYVSSAALLSPDLSVNKALDEFTMMKILSRIEGDKRSIGDKIEKLKVVIDINYPKSHAKLVQMAETLETKQFVSYWV